MVTLLNAIIAEYEFIHPVETADSKSDRLTTCGQVSETLKWLPGQPEDIREDITPYLAKLIRTEFVDKVLKARNFKASEGVRFGYTKMFDKILEYWSGDATAALTTALETQIKDGCKCKEETDAELKWLTQAILPTIVEHATDTTLVDAFIRERGKFNEDHVFDFEDWLWSLQALRQYAGQGLEHVNKWRFNPPPSSEEIA